MLGGREEASIKWGVGGNLGGTPGTTTAQHVLEKTPRIVLRTSLL